MASGLLLRNLSCLRRAHQIGYVGRWTEYSRPVVIRLGERFISSSNKGGPKKGSAIPPHDPIHGGTADIYINEGIIKRPPGPKTVEEFADPKSQKNWISYGFDDVNMSEDRWLAHVCFFIMITCLFGGTIFVGYYYPDIKLDNWATREAYIELHRRKKLGLPTIDRNYVDPAKVVLPSEEEIGDHEVII